MSAVASNEANRLRDKALTAINADRTPGFHFPGHLLGLQWIEVGPQGARVLLPDAPQCRTAGGSVDMTALAIFVDNALSTVSRRDLVPGARLGTVFLAMEFTDTDVRGDIAGEAALFGIGKGFKLRHTFANATLCARGKPFCHATGEFVALDPPAGTVMSPLPWQSDAAYTMQAADEASLAPRELAILGAVDRALARRDKDVSFIESLWHGEKRAAPRSANRQLLIGPHTSNRVGHVQGGLLVGLAAAAAGDAVPQGMSLANISAWFISPGRGKTLLARSRVVHIGRNLSVIRTQIRNGAGVLILEAVSQHVARATSPN